eukprot:5763634-Karenia_brevis.AAC.1
MLRQAIEKGLEWDHPLYVFDGDIFKAYDHTRHSRILDALLKRGVHKALAIAWVREIRRQASIF